MKLLTSIRVVQFFLYEKLDLQIEDVTGIFGPNGSGKSALLDATQIAMFGGSSRLTSFNAQADEGRASTRTIRSYCLGQHGDSEADRVRDRATSYITLVWKDSDTKEMLSMGVCLYAGVERDGHEVLGRYILRGAELSLGDHLELVDGKESPREWPAFRQQLQHRCAAIHGEDPLYADADRYIRAALLALRGNGGVPPADAFIRAFRFALKMRFDRPVDSIVRNQVLEARPTNIKKFREVTESFRRLAAMVADVGKRIDEAQLIKRDFSRAHDEERKSVTWSSLQQDALRELAGQEMETAELGVQTASSAFDTARETLERIQQQKAEAEAEVERIGALRRSHPAEARLGALQDSLQRQQSLLGDKEQELGAVLGLLHRTLRSAKASKFLPTLDQSLTTQIDAVDRLGPVPAIQRALLDQTTKSSLKVIDHAVSELFQVRMRNARQLEEVEAERKGIDDDLERCKQGRAPLSPETRRLLTELRAAKLTPTPVCDLVEITDSQWQPMIEAYLGSNREALLVPPEEEAAAFKVYRGLTGSRMVVGAKIVRASRFEDRRQPGAGSVAELIVGSSRAAVNYLRSKFGEAQRAVSDDECLQQRHAMTADGMLHADGEIDRKMLVRPAQFRIGGGSAGQVDELEAEKTKLGQREQNLQAEETRIKALAEMLGRFTPTAERARDTLKLYDERKSASDSIGSLEVQLSEGADDEYLRLSKSEGEWQAKAKDSAKLETPAAEAKGGLKQRLSTARAILERAKATAKLASDTADAARAQAGYDGEFAQKTWDALLDQFSTRFAEMAQRAGDQAGQCQRRRDAAAANGIAKLGQYLATQREEIAAEKAADWRLATVWVDDLLERLDGTELRNYRAQMEDALRTSQITFRNDVALALHENLRWLDNTFTRLNEVLRSCPVFSNGERYRFKRIDRPVYKSLLSFVDKVAEGGALEISAESLDDIPVQFRELMEERTAPGAAAVASPLDDYREFFEFDIEILRMSPETGKDKVVGHLSKRLGSGSGGEHRAPLYVIAGAALASAYKLDGTKSGIRLMLLDEAFNKMDMPNITATMQYLEQLGLQLLMASPGENLGALSAFLHRYYDLARDATRNVLRMSGHDVTPATRTLFRSDLTEFHPELIDQEIDDLAKGRPSEVVQATPA
jgi:chromosome segregation protein